MEFIPDHDVRKWKARERASGIAYRVTAALLCPTDVEFIPAADIEGELLDHRGRPVRSKTPAGDPTGLVQIAHPRGPAEVEATPIPPSGSPARAGWMMTRFGPIEGDLFAPAHLIRIPYTASLLGVWSQYPVHRSVTEHLATASVSNFGETLLNFTRALLSMWVSGVYPGDNERSSWRVQPLGNKVFYVSPARLRLASEPPEYKMRNCYASPWPELRRMKPEDVVKESASDLMLGMVHSWGPFKRGDRLASPALARLKDRLTESLAAFADPDVSRRPPLGALPSVVAGAFNSPKRPRE